MAGREKERKGEAKSEKFAEKERFVRLHSCHPVKPIAVLTIIPARFKFNSLKLAVCDIVGGFH